jgi:NAD dependent epimerase/dehydratase family enzyme
MHIVIAGGSGFLGSALARALTATDTTSPFLPGKNRTEAPPTSVVRAVDAQRQRRALGADRRRRLGRHQSFWRIDCRQTLVPCPESEASRQPPARHRSLTAAIRHSALPPGAFISGSAVGYYGDRGDETLTESSAAGADFLANLAKDWEAAANDVSHVTRVALVRTGIVLDRQGGALPKMLPPFKMFAGGKLGTGTQYMPWIHKDDWVRLVTVDDHRRRCARSAECHRPSPVTNAEFRRRSGAH